MTVCFLMTLAVFEVCQVDEYILTCAAAQGMTLFETSSCFCLNRSSLESQEELTLPPGFVEDNLVFFFTRLAMGVVGGQSFQTDLASCC